MTVSGQLPDAFSRTFAQPLRGRVLLVEDEEIVRRAVLRDLTGRGLTVTAAADGHEALACFAPGHFDVVVTDIALPGLNGLELLKRLRHLEPALPVVLTTGGPTLETAVDAVALGALRYFIKPYPLDELAECIAYALRRGELELLRARAMEELARADEYRDHRAQLSSALDEAIAGLFMAYQPIASDAGARVVAFEALMRSSATVLQSPLAMIDAARELDRLYDLGRAVRRRVAAELGGTDADLFVNLHPAELEDPELYGDANPLNPFARRVVFELTEQAALDGPELKERVKLLRQRGFRIAIDDFGTGFSGLNAFAQLMPDVLKLDRALVRGVDTSGVQQKLMRSIATLGRDLGVSVLAEGIETAAELETACAAGIDLFQGYWLARPGKPFPELMRAA